MSRKNPATVQERIERTRARAIDAMAWLASATGDLHDNGILRLVSLAVQDYRLKFPHCPAKNTWLFYDGKPTQKIRGNPERVDVFCLFCRELLVSSAIWNHDYTDDLRLHTTLCALRSLGGLLTPGAPHTYKLPSGGAAVDPMQRARDELAAYAAASTRPKDGSS